MAKKAVFSVSGTPNPPLSNLNHGKGSSLLNQLKHDFELTEKFTGNFLLCVDHSSQALRKFKRAGGLAKNTILVRYEPISVHPAQYKPNIEKLYGLIISPGHISEAIPTKIDIGCPYSYQANPMHPSSKSKSIAKLVTDNEKEGIYRYANWKNRPITLSMIASNKVSPIKNSNYALRRNLAMDLEHLGLQVYGALWVGDWKNRIRNRIGTIRFSILSGKMPNLRSVYGNFFRRYKTTFGVINDKHQILKQSKFSMIVENSNDYISEKVFDALLNGCIPIYIGPDVSKLPFPKDLINNFSGDPQEIYEYVLTVKEQAIESKLTVAKEFFLSDAFTSTWSEEAVNGEICERIKIFVASKYGNSGDA